MKTQATDWEKIFAKHVSNNEFTSRVYKKLLLLNYKKTIP